VCTNTTAHTKGCFGRNRFSGKEAKSFRTSETDGQNDELKMRHSVTTGSTTTDKALPYKGRDQAATFLWLLSFERKESDNHSPYNLEQSVPNGALIRVPRISATATLHPQS